MEYKIGDVYEANTGKSIILDVCKIETKKINKASHLEYKCKCLRHDYKYTLNCTQINNKVGCPICGTKAVLGYNTFYDLRPDLVQYFKNPEESKKIRPRSNKYFTMKCPICGYEKDMAVCNLYAAGFSCDKCSDGISYPNKFMRSLFDQIGIKYEIEKSFSWSGRKSYDQYFPEYNLVVENHGKQHYTNDFMRDDLAIDKLKKNMAELNGLTYLAIDCYKSETEYIKNSVMNSILPKLFGFTEDNIDWQECNKQGLSSKVLQVCEDWNRTQDYDYVAQKYKLAIPTIRSYIQRGIEIGLCNTEYYCDISERISVCSQEAQAKPIYSITDDIYFFSSHTAEEYYKKQGLVYQAGSILRAAREEKEYKGKCFEIITKQEFNEYFLDSNKITIGKLFNEKYFNLQNHKLKSA